MKQVNKSDGEGIDLQSLKHHFQRFIDPVKSRSLKLKDRERRTPQHPTAARLFAFTPPLPSDSPFDFFYKLALSLDRHPHPQPVERQGG